MVHSKYLFKVLVQKHELLFITIPWYNQPAMLTFIFIYASKLWKTASHNLCVSVAETFFQQDIENVKYSIIAHIVVKYCA
jgi:hypothetical protein